MRLTPEERVDALNKCGNLAALATLLARELSSDHYSELAALQRLSDVDHYVRKLSRAFAVLISPSPTMLYPLPRLQD